MHNHPVETFVRRLARDRHLLRIYLLEITSLPLRELSKKKNEFREEGGHTFGLAIKSKTYTSLWFLLQPQMDRQFH